MEGFLERRGRGASNGEVGSCDANFRNAEARAGFEPILRCGWFSAE